MTKSNLKTHRKCKKCNQLLENKFFNKRAEGKKTEYFSTCIKCEADAIQTLISFNDEQRSDYSDNVSFMYENYYKEVLNMIFWRYSSLNDTENRAAEIMYSIFYTNIDSESQKEKKAKIKSYDSNKGSFKNWLNTIVKNECINQIAKQSLIGDKRIKKNKIKLLVDILTARVSNEPVSTSRMGSLTATGERFMRWRTIDGETIDPLGENWDLETLVRGLFNKKTFLNYVRYFSIFISLVVECF